MTTTDAARAPRRDATRNRAALLAAARRTLRLDPDASIDAIATAAGLTRRAVYGHFASREALVGELAVDAAARVALAAAALRDDDPVVDIALVGRLVWDEVESFRAAARVVVRGPLRESALHGALAPLHLRLVDDVRRAAATGAGRSDLEPDTVARLIEGAAFAVLDESVRSPLDRAAGRRLVILAGLGALGLSWREAQAVLVRHAARLVQEDAR